MRRNNKQRGNEGIALIIVLGLLSILIIFAVAFSISMRTERLATRSFLDVVRTRQLVHTAINRVIGEHISDEIEGMRRVYPEFDVFTAPLPPDAGELLDILADGTLQSPFVFVSRSLREEARALGIDTGVPWLPLLDPTLSPTHTNAFQGEYAFLVVNNSGLLDANVIGEYEHEETPRRRGFEPGEIRFHPSILPEVRTAESLRLYRNEFRRFESVPELYFLTSSDGGGPANPSGTDVQTAIGPLPIFHAGDDGAANPPRFVDNLHVFSRYPRGYAEIAPDGAWVANTNVADISGPPATWNLTILDDVISDIIPNASHRAMFINALYDYADEGYVPRGDNPDEQFRRFNAKPVPMINEVIISNSLTRIEQGDATDPDLLEHRIHITIETWFPFPADPDNTPFTIEITNLVYSGWFPPYPGFQAGEPQISGPEPASFIPDPDTPQLTQFTIRHEQPIMYQGAASPPALPYPFPGFGEDFNVTVNIGEIRVMQGGQPVDVVFGPWPATAFEFPGVQPPLPDGQLVGLGPGGNAVVRAFAANDPRINWDPHNTLHWRNVGVAGMSPGEINDVRITGEQEEHGYLSDEINRMYAARGPLQSVGEVGYLLFDPTRPWTTIRLLNEPGHPHHGTLTNMTRLLDRLAVHPSMIRRGMVNLNTRQTNALWAALFEMPIEQFPDPNELGQAMNLDQTQRLTQEIMNLGHNTATYSDFVNRLDSDRLDTIIGSSDDKFLRESVIRNSLGVLGVRNNVFTIFVAARVYTDDYDHTNPDHQNNREEYVLADQRAVAVVWRDPFRTRDSTGNETYRSWMQYFLWETGAIEAE